METPVNDTPATALKPAVYMAALHFFVSTPTIVRSEQYREVLYLIVWPRDGEILINGADGDRYILTRVNGSLSLSYPENDYTGDPSIVEWFNAVIQLHS